MVANTKNGQSEGEMGPDEIFEIVSDDAALIRPTKHQAFVGWISASAIHQPL
ncbi:hypothetical protein BADSM9389_01960 [Buttiauxella agrestis]|nr:hypothetical protein BADSM9389_01960 [Buttiauxella agrestis]